MVVEAFAPPRSSQWQFLDALGDGVYGVDPQGTAPFVNAAALRMLGYDRPDELIGRNMHDRSTTPARTARPFPRPSARCCTRRRAACRCGWITRCCGAATARRSSPNTPPSRCSTAAPSPAASSPSATHRSARTPSVAWRCSMRSPRCWPAPAAERNPPRASSRPSAPGWPGMSGCSGSATMPSRPRPVLRCVADWRSRDAGAAARSAATASAPGWNSPPACPARSGQWRRRSTSPTSAPRRRARARPRPRRLGLRSALAFPLMDGTTVVGASSSTASQRIDVDETLLEAVATLGHQIGQTLERRPRRRRAQPERAPEGRDPGRGTRLRDHRRWPRPDRLEFNAPAESIFGRSAETVIGQDLGRTIFPADTQGARRRDFARALRGRRGGPRAAARGRRGQRRGRPLPRRVLHHPHRGRRPAAVHRCICATSARAGGSRRGCGEARHASAPSPTPSRSSPG